MRLDHLLARESDRIARQVLEILDKGKLHSIMFNFEGPALVKCMEIWGYSSVGRAPALQAGGQGFESLYLHHMGQ